MIDDFILWFGKSGYIVTLIVFIFKTGHFLLYNKWSFSKFLYFSNADIVFSRKAASKRFKITQNTLTLLIIVTIVIQLMIFYFIFNQK